jgi:hypothetical protein
MLKNYTVMFLMLFSSSILLGLALKNVFDYSMLVGVSLGTVFLLCSAASLGEKNQQQNRH